MAITSFHAKDTTTSGLVAAILNFRYTQMSDIVGSHSVELSDVDNMGVAFGICWLWTFAEM